jgi:hypothetical protein
MEQRINENGPISFRDIILKVRDWYNYILSKWKILIVISALGGILGYLYAKTQNPVYSATTTFVLEESNSGLGALGNLGGLASIAGLDGGSGNSGIFQGDNILELYKSRSMIEKTLFTPVNNNGTKELLIDTYVRMNNLQEKWAENSALKSLTFVVKDTVATDTSMRSSQRFRLQDSVVGSIVYAIRKNNLNVYKSDKKLSIISADVKAEDEFFAKAFNEEIVRNVNNFYVQTKTLKSLENVRILQMKTDSIRDVMNGAIYSSAAAIDATPNLNPTRQAQRSVPAQRSQYSAETNKAILSELVKNLELSKMTLLKEAPLIQVVDRPVFPLDVIRLGGIKAAVMGTILFAFLTIFVLLIKYIFAGILSEKHD